MGVLCTGVCIGGVVCLWVGGLVGVACDTFAGVCMRERVCVFGASVIFYACGRVCLRVCIRARACLLFQFSQPGQRAVGQLSISRGLGGRPRTAFHGLFLGVLRTGLEKRIPLPLGFFSL